MLWALLGALGTGPADTRVPTAATRPTASTSSPAALTQTAVGSGGRAAWAGGPFGAPVTVCTRPVCAQPRAAGASGRNSTASRARALAQRLLTVPSGMPRSVAASATE